MSQNVVKFIFNIQNYLINQSRYIVLLQNGIKKLYMHYIYMIWVFVIKQFE